MVRPNSTVVAIVGDAAGRMVAGLDGLANVRAVSRAPGDDAERRVRAAVAQSHAAYVVHDLDPLADVGAAWTGFFDGVAPAGTLEVAVEAALHTLRAETIALPDYYVVLDPEALPQTRRHWWFGVLAGVSPNRVVPSAADVGAVREVIGTLRSGRWWPDPPDEWLRGLGRVVPDRAVLAG
ncbi:hypothetical protein [Jiangella anatolica]|uniref:Uncharacterized protein n=1 Tax=Jiangella anatolica TaxID=2670374 RepID=A0A2W2BT23_9ACTN|nr:hypothetical protein [Jiangella anatolica]PZF79289.1 hypothetical protein C1I92_31875 [Jiangella anatolica]